MSKDTCGRGTASDERCPHSWACSKDSLHEC